MPEYQLVVAYIPFPIVHLFRRSLPDPMLTPLVFHDVLSVLLLIDSFPIPPSKLTHDPSYYPYLSSITEIRQSMLPICSLFQKRFLSSLFIRTVLRSVHPSPAHLLGWIVQYVDTIQAALLF